MLRISIAAAVLAAFAAGAVSGVSADDKPVKPWERKEVQVKPPKDSPLDYLVSGYWFRTPKTRALQDDDFENPAFLWVEQAEGEWTTVDGKAGKSCSSCHDAVEKSMKGVSARYPVYSAKTRKMMAVTHQVNYCRENYMKAKKWKWESDKMLGMTSLIGLQSRGMPVKTCRSTGRRKSSSRRARRSTMSAGASSTWPACIATRGISASISAPTC